MIIALPFWQHHRLPETGAHLPGRWDRISRRAGSVRAELDRVNVANLSGIPLIGLKELSLKGGNLLLKRAIDLTLIAAWPRRWCCRLAVLIALAIKLRFARPGDLQAACGSARMASRSPPISFARWWPMPRRARPIWPQLNEADGPIFKMRDDPRMTRIGRFLRRSSLDELPQLWNVLRDEMSLVGPRPQMPDEVAQYEEWHRRRLEVNPGLTGLWQVLGPQRYLVRRDGAARYLLRRELVAAAWICGSCSRRSRQCFRARARTKLEAYCMPGTYMYH